jgi:hypothetical protein
MRRTWRRGTRFKEPQKTSQLPLRSSNSKQRQQKVNNGRGSSEATEAFNITNNGFRNNISIKRECGHKTFVKQRVGPTCKTYQMNSCDRNINKRKLKCIKI